MSLRRLILISAVLLPSAIHPAQSTQATPDQPELVLRSTTRLVQVEVIVRSKDGKPIQGLRQEDFEVFENGKPQQIRFFSDYALDGRQREKLPEGMGSNRPGVTGPRRGVTVILIDSLNTNWHNRDRAHRNLLRFLETAKPDDRIAIYTLGRELRVVHDFTGDASSLIERVRANRHAVRVVDPIADNLKLDLIPDAERLLRNTESVHRSFLETNRIRQTLDTLESIAEHLGTSPGWKSLIWISEGVPLMYGFTPAANGPASRFGPVDVGEKQTFGVEFRRARQALSNANVAVFPISPAGLQAWPEEDATNHHQGGFSSFGANSYMMEQLASFTGGRAYANGNDILSGLRRAVDDARMSYTLGYYPSDQEFDGGYRTIRVRMRQPDLHPNHRKGYYAIDEAEMKRLEPKEAMLSAVRDPLDSSLIGIDGQVLPSDGKLKVILRIQAGDLLWPAGEEHEVVAEVALAQFNQEGRSLDGFVDSIHFKLDPARAAILARDGMMYSREFVLQPGAVRLRAVVRSVRTGSIGSLTLPFPAPGS